MKLQTLEFKKISDFPKGTLYNQLVDAYSFDGRCKEFWNDAWKEYGVKKIKVTTNELTLPAQKNYESVGFVKIEERENTETSFAGKYLDYEMPLK